MPYVNCPRLPTTMPKTTDDGRLELMINTGGVGVDIYEITLPSS